MTVEVFKSIAGSHEPVDVGKAVSAGAVLEDGASSAAAAEESEMEAERAAHEILLSLPGVTVHNFREVLHRVENLAELSTLSEAQLEPMLGPVNAKKLYSFFKQRRLA